MYVCVVRTILFFYVTLFCCDTFHEPDAVRSLLRLFSLIEKCSMLILGGADLLLLCNVNVLLVLFTFVCVTYLYRHG